MRFSISQADIKAFSARNLPSGSAWLFGIFAAPTAKGKNTLAAALEAALAPLPAALRAAISAQASSQHFAGKKDQICFIHSFGPQGQKVGTVALLGLGHAADCAQDTWQHFGASAGRFVREQHLAQLSIFLPKQADADALSHLALGMHLHSYRFADYSASVPKEASAAKITLWAAGAKKNAQALGLQLEQVPVLAQAIGHARDLVNRAPRDLYPESFAAAITKLGRQAKLKVTVFKPPALRKMKMDMLLAVGQGSSLTPRFVEVRYVPKGARAKKQPPVVLVGKGITFDSGGLCLKPPDGMMNMKYDMAGAAAVVATVWAAAQLALPVPVVALLPLAENMPSGNAYRLGDVLRGGNGKTVEINNTDAEGRLILADALCYAARLQPRLVIDMATLTGACMVALGPHTMGMFSNDDALASALLQAAHVAGEDAWRLPLTPKLRDQLKSDIADMRNTGERYGGAITAALFLQEFAPPCPWAHFDIAGPASGHGPGSVKGGTGAGVGTLLTFLSLLGNASA